MAKLLEKLGWRNSITLSDPGLAVDVVGSGWEIRLQALVAIRLPQLTRQVVQRESRL